MVHRHRQGPWNGPECPWCGGEMTKLGADGAELIFGCGGNHTVRVLDVEPEDEDDEYA